MKKAGQEIPVRLVFWPHVGFYVGFWDWDILSCYRKSSKKFTGKAKTVENKLLSTVNVGADTRIRTGDLILTKDALYLLSYISKGQPPL